MPENQNRLGRIDEEYKKEISQIISYQLKNPNVTGLISVTKVKVTNDLKYAKVYVSILNSKNLKETMEGLKKSVKHDMDGNCDLCMSCFSGNYVTKLYDSIDRANKDEK